MKLTEQLWQTYKETVVQPTERIRPANSAGVMEAKLAFFAGMTSLKSALYHIARTSGDSKAGEEATKALMQELNDFPLTLMTDPELTVYPEKRH